MRSLFVKRILLLSAFLLIGLDTEGSPQREIALNVSMSEGTASSNLSFSFGETSAVEAGFSTSLAELAARNVYMTVDSQDYSTFVGNGKATDGFALRLKPYGRIVTSTSSLWTKGDAKEGSSLLFGFGASGVRFFVAAEPESGDGQGASMPIGERLGAIFRCSGMEIGTGTKPFSCALSASVADRPGEASGDGWSSGSSAKAGSTLFTLSSAAKLAGDGFNAGVWGSGSAGFFERPGVAGAIDVAVKFPLLMAAGRKSLGVDRSFDDSFLFLSAFLSGSSSGYRTPSGESSLYDFFAEAAVSFRVEALTLAAGIAAGSFSEGKTGAASRLIDESSASSLKMLLWLWRTEMARVSLDLGYAPFSLAGRLLADSRGLHRGTLALRFKPHPSKGSGLAFGASAGASFARSGASDEEDDEDDEDDELGSQADSAIAIGDWWEEGFAGDLELRSCSIEGSLGWNGGKEGGRFRRGTLDFALSRKKVDDRIAFSVSCAISQGFRLFGTLDMSIAIKSPEGGYALDAIPQKLPCLSIEASLLFG